MLDTLNLVPPVVLLYFFCTPSLSVLAFAHPPTLAKSRVADRMGLGCYLLSLLFVGEPETSSHCPALGPGGARRSGEFHRHRGVQLGAGGWRSVGPQYTGQIMAWVGTAMYAAFAVGAPAGTSLYTAHGFAAIANDERVPVVWRWIGTQRVVVYPERFAVIGEPLNCLCNVSTGTVARTIIG
jgi:hypothetical protein